MKGDFEKRVVTAAYEVTEPTVRLQVVNLKSSGAEALFIAGTPKFAAQAIRKAAEIGWKAKIIINFPSGSIGGTLKPAGLENSVGVIVGTINKDPTDSKWNDDEGVRAYKAFFARYLAGADFENTSYLTGYMQGMILERILKQCGDDPSRKSILKQAKSLIMWCFRRRSGNRGQYRRIQQHDLEPDAVAAMERQQLGAVRRGFGRKFRMKRERRGRRATSRPHLATAATHGELA